MNPTTAPSYPAGAIAPEPFPERTAISHAAAGIGLYAGAFGITFGTVSAASELRMTQAVAMSAVMFTGASQFALVSVLAAGGSPLAGLSAALLLGLRNTFYGLPVTHILRPRGVRRLWTAHFVIDESTAMGVSPPSSSPTSSTPTAATAPTGTRSPGSAPAPSRSVLAGRSLSSSCSRSPPRPSCG